MKFTRFGPKTGGGGWQLKIGLLIIDWFPNARNYYSTQLVVFWDGRAIIGWT